MASCSADRAQKLWIVRQNGPVYSGRNLSCLAEELCSYARDFLLSKQTLIQYTSPSLPLPTVAI